MSTSSYENVTLGVETGEVSDRLSCAEVSLVTKSQKDFMVELRYIVEYICLPVALIGISGNILALVIFCVQRRKTTTVFILGTLAVVDTLCLLSILSSQTSVYFSLKMGHYDSFKPAWKIIFRWVFPSVYIFRMVGMWLVATLTVDRWIAVCRPLHAQQMCTLASGYRRVAATITFGILFSLPRFFEDPQQYGFPISDFEGFYLNQFYAIIYRGVLFTVFMYILPLAVTVFLNIKLVLSLKASDPAVVSLRQHLIKNGAEDRSQREQRNVTIVVIIVCCVSVLCSTVAMTSQALYTTEMCFCEWVKADIEIYRRTSSEIGQILTVINSSSNIFIYTIFSKNFRSNLKTCCKTRCKNNQNNSRISTHRRVDPTLSNDGTETLYLHGVQAGSAQLSQNSAEQRLKFLNDKYI